MILEPEKCYQALLTHDRRFDGRFFVGVSSTGIYCRPVCTARTPRRENCRFFVSAAAAEIAGHRPCLRCRPELAPGKSSVDSSTRLAYSAAALIHEGFLSGKSLEELASHLEISARHLRRVFHDAFGVTPVAYLQTHRLLLAKQLLTDSRLPVIDVALASDFQSLRRFNALFKSRYGLAPSRLRASEGVQPHRPPRAGTLHRPALPQGNREEPGLGPKTEAEEGKAHEWVSFHLGFRPPFDWEGLLRFLEQRTIPGVEEVSGGVYRRTVSLLHRGKHQEKWLEGVIEVRPPPKADCLTVRMSAALVPLCALILERVKRLFDLSAEPSEIEAALGKLAAPNPGLRVPGCFDGFEMAVRAILGQQISVRAARTLAGRLAARFGRQAKCGFPGLTTIFPDAPRLAHVSPDPVDALASIGLVRKRAEAIRALAQAVASNQLALHPGAPLAGTLRALGELPGIGAWTVEYIAMRALSWPDAFPHTDLGVKKALNESSVSKILKKAEAWRPWRAYATLHLWRTLEETV